MAKESAPKKAGGVGKAAGKGVQTGQAAPKRLTVRIGDDLNAEVQALADARNMSASAVVRTAVEMYLQREQFAVGLSDVESNMAASLNAARKETARVGDDVQLVIAFLDQFLRFSMIAAPEVIDKQGAAALMHRRYEGFLSELHKAFYSRRKKAALTQTLETMEGSESGIH